MKCIVSVLASVVLMASAFAQTVLAGPLVSSSQARLALKFSNPLRVIDSTGKSIGRVIENKCHIGSSVTGKFDTMTVLAKINGDFHYICVSSTGVVGFKDVLYTTADCSGTAYVSPNDFFDGPNSLVTPSLTSNQAGTPTLFGVDYASGQTLITYNSYRNFDGNCVSTPPTGPSLRYPLVEVADLSAKFTAPFELR